MKLFRECKTEEEKQLLRDEMLEHMYHQALECHHKIAQVKDMIDDLRIHIDFLSLPAEVRKYKNEDGSINRDAFIELCVQLEKELSNGQ